MSIIRVNKDSRYFTASNEPFNDKRLHWETRGLLAYLLSKPNNWQVRLSDLENQGPAKGTKIRKMLKDAQKHGYMNRVRVVKPDGTFIWMTEIYESPSLNPSPQSSGGFSTSGLSTSGKPAYILNTEGINTDSDDEGRPPKENIYSLYEANFGPITPMIADALKDAEQTYPAGWIPEAMRLAVENNKRNWKYCLAILDRWQRDGKDDGRKPEKKTRSKGGETPLDRYARERGCA